MARKCVSGEGVRRRILLNGNAMKYNIIMGFIFFFFFLLNDKLKSALKKKVLFVDLRQYSRPVHSTINSKTETFQFY